MSKWNLIVDVAKCENCHNCTLATKDEHVGNDFHGYAAPQPLHGHEWIKIQRRVRGEGSMVDTAYLPTMCNHCDDAPCLKAGGSDGAVRKRDDGIIIIDPQKAKGRRELVDSCPYGAIWWNDELKLPQIWIFDAHLLDEGWKEPRCQQSCPTGVYRALKVEDGEMQELARRENLEVLRPDLGTKPRVYYRNLHRYAKNFLAGSVAADVDGVEECVVDARVALHQGGRVVAETVTNAFGDFKFDSLDGKGEKYRVEITHATLGIAATDVELEESRYIDPIQVRPAPIS
jgi:Fe-S-cluster-containing dehydrogenase component